jgi:hypothetical protein
MLRFPIEKFLRRHFHKKTPWVNIKILREVVVRIIEEIVDDERWQFMRGLFFSLR